MLVNKTVFQKPSLCEYHVIDTPYLLLNSKPWAFETWYTKPGKCPTRQLIGRRRRRKPKLDLSKYDLEQLSEVAQTVGSGKLLLLMDLVCWPSFSGCSINKQHYSKWQWSEIDASSKPMTLQYVYECSFLKRMTFGCLLTYVCPCACIFSTQKE